MRPEMLRLTYLVFTLVFVAGDIYAAAATQTFPQSFAEHRSEIQEQKQGERSMMARCQEMISQREDMQRMQELDKKLDDLVAEMNKAKGVGKVDALAKVVTEIAAQHKQACRQMNGPMCSMTDHSHDGLSAAGCCR